MVDRPRRYLVEEITLDCADGVLTRREALRRLGLLGVSGAAAGALLAACGDDDAANQTTATNATSVGGGEEIRFAGPEGELIGVFAEPGGGAGRGGRCSSSTRTVG